MHTNSLKFTVTVTLDESNTYAINAKSDNGGPMKVADIRNALQWALNRTNDEMIAGMIQSAMTQLLTVPK